MGRDYRQATWDEETADDCRQLVRLAIREDLDRHYDWTTVGLIADDATGTADVVARKGGVVAGLPALALAVEEFDADIAFEATAKDGQKAAPGAVLASLSGSARDILACERTLLNLLGRLMGVATQTARYVEQITGTKACIYDTRKTTPGWRRLEKYAVRCGGGRNHRLGLYDGVLIKDNHLAEFRAAGQSRREAAASAVRRMREFLADTGLTQHAVAELLVEIEVDDFEQLSAVLPEKPDIVLLDNMSIGDLKQAVAMRDAVAEEVELEASGGITLGNLLEVAKTGVDRISVGALTHSAVAVDVGLDWRTG